MPSPTILVTGATGKTGGAVVAQLLEKGWPVRAVVRTRDARSEKLDRLGAQTVVADLFDPASLREAMRGTTRAYFSAPFHPHMIEGAVAFALAAQEAQLRSIVGLSQWLASPSHPSLATRQHWLVDRLFARLPGIAHTVVNPGFFADYPYLQLMRYAAHLGLFPMPVDGASRNAPPSVNDIARVAVAALTDPDRHAGKTYRPTGPELLSVNDMTEIIGRVVGHKVRHVKLPMWMLYKAARLDGVSRFELSGLRHYLKDHDAGAFAVGGPTTDVLDVTGRAPESFETIARRHAARPEVRQTVGNRLRTLVQFMAVPLMPGFAPDRYDRALGFDMPSRPRLAMDDDHWQAERLAQVARAPSIALRRAG